MTPKDLRASLTSWAESARGFMPQLPGSWLMQSFIACRGIDCIAQPLPRKFRRRTPKACFANTYDLLRSRPAGHGLRYCEGYMQRDRLPIPIHHAWAIDGADRVIDVTLEHPEWCAYVGYPVDAEEYLAEVFKGIRGKMMSASLFLDLNEVVNDTFILARCPELTEFMENV